MAGGEKTMLALPAPEVRAVIVGAQGVVLLAEILKLSVACRAGL